MPAKANLEVLVSARNMASGALNSATQDVGKFEGAVKKAGMAYATAAAGAVTASVALATSFDKAFSQVETLFPNAEGQVASLRGEILELSKTMGVDAVGQTQALYQALSAGVPKDNVMTFMETATKAAIGGTIETTQAVDVLTNVMNAFKIEAGDAERVSDILFTTVARGKTDMGELSQNMFQVAPAAAAAGVEFEEVAAALASVTKQGVPTAQATTQLRQAIVELQKPGADLKNALADIGFASGTAALEAEGLQGTLRLLAQNAESEGNSIVQTFSSVEAGSAALALTGENAQVASEDLAAMAETAGTTQAAFETMNDTAARKFERTQEKVKNLGIEFGQQLLPSVETGVDVVGNLVDVFGDLETDTQQMIVLGGGLAGALTRVNTKAGLAAGSLVILAGTLNEVGEATLGIGLKDAFDEIVDVVQGEGGASQSVREFVDDYRQVLQRWVADGAEPARLAAHNLAVQLGEIDTKNLSGGELAATTEIIGFLADETNRLGVDSATLADIYRDLGPAAQEVMLEQFGPGSQNILEAAHASRELGGGMRDAAPAIREVGEVLGPTREQLGLLPEDIRVVKDAGGIFNEFVLEMQAAAENGETSVEEMRTGLSESYQGMISDIQNTLLPGINESFDDWAARLEDTAEDHRNFESNLTTIYENLKSANVENVDEIIAAVAEQGPEYAANFAQFFAEDPEAAIRILKDVAPDITNETASDMLRELGILAPGVSKEFQFASDEAIAKLEGMGVEGASTMAAAVEGIMNGAFTEDDLIRWSSQFQRIGLSAIEGIAVGMSNQAARNSIAAAASAAIAAGVSSAEVAAGIRSPSKVFADLVGKPIAEGIAFGIESGTGAVVDALSNLIANIRDVAAVQADEDTSLSMIDQFIFGRRQDEYMANLEERFGEIGAAVANGLTTVLAEGEGGGRLADFVTRLLDEAEAVGVPKASELGEKLDEAMAKALASGSPEAVQAVLDIVAQINTAIEEAGEEPGRTLIEAFEEGYGDAKRETRLEERIGSDGTRFVLALEEAIAAGSPDAIARVGELAEGIVGTLGDALDPGEANALSSAFMTELRKVIAEEGEATLADLLDILGRIHTVGEEAEGADGGGGGSGGGSGGSSGPPPTNIRADSDFYNPETGREYRINGRLIEYRDPGRNTWYTLLTLREGQVGTDIAQDRGYIPTPSGGITIGGGADRVNLPADHPLRDRYPYWDTLPAWVQRQYLDEYNANYTTPNPGAAGGPKQLAHGMGRVPYDNFAAMLHRDEAVLNAVQAREWREGSGKTVVVNVNAEGYVQDVGRLARDIQRELELVF